MKNKTTTYAAFLLVLSTSFSFVIKSQNCNLLCNTDFDNVQHVSAGSWALVPNGNVPCWRTTEASGDIEVWGSGMLGIPSYSGGQFIEMDAYELATIYQNFTVAPGTNITLGFAHRGRLGIDSIRVSLGPVGGPYVSLGDFGDGTAAWGYYNVNYIIPMALGNMYSLRFTATYASAGQPSFGNFLDAVSITFPHPALVTNSTNVICYNQLNGTANAVVNSGTTPYTYNWTNASVSNNVNNLGIGTYSVLITDANGCTAQSSVTITQPTLLQAFIPAQTNIMCNGNNTGAASGAAIGGTTPYNYSWSNGVLSQNATGLTTGNMQVTITDANGCTATASTNITQPQSLTVNIPQSANLLCYNDGKGYANSTTAGGVAPYVYSWSNASTKSAISFLQAGVYTVTVTDSYNCTATATIGITEPTQLIANIVATQDESCSGKNDGSIQAAVNGGTLPYVYTWSNTSATLSINNLTAGVYTLTVVDGNNCNSIVQSTVIAAIALTNTITFTNVLCYGGTSGSASINVSGGSPGYNYSWSNNNLTLSINNVPAGIYTVTVSDINNCNITIPINITEPPQLVLLTSNSTAICSGQNYAITSAASGGVVGYSYNWSNGTFTSNNLVSPVQQTVYTLTVTDNNSCTAIGSVTVSVNELPVVSFTADKREGCEPTCIVFTNTTPNTQTATWQFSALNFQVGDVINQCYNNAGLYDVKLVITDNNGCVSSLTENSYITIHPTPTAAFNANPQPTTILNPTINFSNLSQNYVSSVWSFGDVLNGNSTETNPSFTYGDTGTFVVRLVVENEFGCSAVADDIIYIAPDVSVFVPNTFTPNGDPKNEIFMISGIGIDGENFEMLIYDRWGNVIFTSTNLTKGWDGNMNGTPVQIDTYVYKIKYLDIMGAKHKLIGRVNLIR